MYRRLKVENLDNPSKKERWVTPPLALNRRWYLDSTISPRHGVCDNNADTSDVHFRVGCSCIVGLGAAALPNFRQNAQRTTNGIVARTYPRHTTAEPSVGVGPAPGAHVPLCLLQALSGDELKVVKESESGTMQRAMVSFCNSGRSQLRLFCTFSRQDSKALTNCFCQNLLGICPCDSAMQLLRLGRGTPRVAHSCAQEWGDVYYIPWSVHIGPTAALSLCNPKSPCLRMAIPRPLQSLSLPLLGGLGRGLMVS